MQFGSGKGAQGQRPGNMPVEGSDLGIELHRSKALKGRDIGDAPSWHLSCSERATSMLTVGMFVRCGQVICKNYRKGAEGIYTFQIDSNSRVGALVEARTPRHESLHFLQLCLE